MLAAHQCAAGEGAGGVKLRISGTMRGGDHECYHGSAEGVCESKRRGFAIGELP